MLINFVKSLFHTASRGFTDNITHMQVISITTFFTLSSLIILVVGNSVLENIPGVSYPASHGLLKSYFALGIINYYSQLLQKKLFLIYNIIVILYLPYSPPLEQKTTLEPALTRKNKKKDK